MKKAIGILGGMGPSASAYMYKLLIDMAIDKFGAKNNDDFPEIILYSVPVPDFISNNKAKQVALTMLEKRVASLNSINLSSLSIVCNTAHILIDDLQSISRHEFVSMIEEVSRSVFQYGIRKVGILATPSTLHFNLYQQELSNFGIMSIMPEEKEIKSIEKIIRNVLAGKIKQSDEKLILQIADSLMLKGAQGIILGCTEIPLVFPKKYKFPVFNSVEILSQALLRKYYK